MRKGFGLLSLGSFSPVFTVTAFLRKGRCWDSRYSSFQIRFSIQKVWTWLNSSPQFDFDFDFCNNWNNLADMLGKVNEFMYVGTVNYRIEPGPDHYPEFECNQSLSHTTLSLLILMEKVVKVLNFWSSRNYYNPGFCLIIYGLHQSE